MEGGGDDFAKGDFVEGDFETEERFADGEDESSPEEDERAEERCRSLEGGDFAAEGGYGKSDSNSEEGQGRLG